MPLCLSVRSLFCVKGSSLERGAVPPLQPPKPNQVSPPVVVEAFLIAACRVQVSLSSMGAFSSGPERLKRKQHQQGWDACLNHCMAKSNNIQFSEFI